MVVIVDVSVAVPEAERPPTGRPVRVEVRDVTRADAESVVVAVADDEVRGRHGTWLTTVELDVGEIDPRRDLTVWARVAGSSRRARGAAAAPGDYITMQSYPLTASSREQRLGVIVKAI